MERRTFSEPCLRALTFACAITSLAFTWPWEVGGPWPSSARVPVHPLDHPTLEQTQTAGPAAQQGFRFAVYGDQCALADGEWQRMIDRIATIDAQDRLPFIIDTGDIVQDGRFTDQFQMLRRILAPVGHLPLLVGVGNHFLDDDRPSAVRDSLYLAAR